MSSKRLLIFVLLIVTLILGGVGIYVGITQSNQLKKLPTTGAPSNVIWTNNPCTGACGSGSECNQYGDPPVDKMWSCWYNNNAGGYRCSYTDINDGGNACYYAPGTCATGPCGCNEFEGDDSCNSKCLESIDPGESGTYTMECDNCKQLFTCSCEKPAEVIHPCGDQTFNCLRDAQCESSTSKGVKQICDVNGKNCRDESTTEKYAVECREYADSSLNRCGLTKTACPTGYTDFTEVRNGVGVCGCRKNAPPTTTPPTTTPPTTTPATTTPTKTLVPTALISDEVDRMIIGAVLLILGLSFFSFGVHVRLGNLFWNVKTPKVVKPVELIDAKTKQAFAEERVDFENRF